MFEFLLPVEKNKMLLWLVENYTSIKFTLKTQKYGISVILFILLVQRKNNNHYRAAAPSNTRIGALNKTENYEYKT